MALTLTGCIKEPCSGLQFVDQTGPYGATNSTGYGALNDITSPSDFDSYVLELWTPSQDTAEDDPAFTLDLLADVPTADDDGYYTWTITAEDLGFDTDSGVYTVRVTGTYQGDEYVLSMQPILLNELEGLVDSVRVTYDPSCPCKTGCADQSLLYAQFLILKGDGDCCGCASVHCNAEKAQDIITYLRHELAKCCD